MCVCWVRCVSVTKTALLSVFRANHGGVGLQGAHERTPSLAGTAPSPPFRRAANPDDAALSNHAHKPYSPTTAPWMYSTGNARASALDGD